MPDLAHQWGEDLSLGATGDLAIADGSMLCQQRVLRRLLTNPGDYIWQLEYGAGLAQFLGEPASETRIKATIRGQIFKEQSVAKMPEPTIDVQVSPGGAAGTVYVQLTYFDNQSGQTQALSFSVTG